MSKWSSRGPTTNVELEHDESVSNTPDQACARGVRITNGAPNSGPQTEWCTQHPEVLKSGGGMLEARVMKLPDLSSQAG